MCIQSAFHLYLRHHAFRVLTHLSSLSPCINFVSEPKAHFCLPVHAYWVSSHLFASTRIISVSLLISVFPPHPTTPTDFCVPVSAESCYRCLYSCIISLPLLFSMFPSHLTATTDLCSRLIYSSLLIILYPSHLCTLLIILYPSHLRAVLISVYPSHLCVLADFCVPVSFHCPYWFHVFLSHLVG